MYVYPHCVTGSAVHPAWSDTKAVQIHLDKLQVSAQVTGMVPLAQYARRFLEHRPARAAVPAPALAAPPGSPYLPHTLTEPDSASRHPALAVQGMQTLTQTKDMQWQSNEV